MKCEDIMSKDIKWCTPDCSVKRAVEIMQQQNCGAIPIVNENHELQGIVTDRDITLNVILQKKDPETTELKEFMSTDIITCTPEQSVDAAIEKMKDYQIRRIPVVDDEFKLLGLISLGDIALKSGEEHETFEALEYISQSGGFNR